MPKLIASIVCLMTAATLAPAGGAKSGTIEGTWQASAAVANGKKIPKTVIDAMPVMMTFANGKYVMKIADRKPRTGTYATDASKKPATIDMQITQGPGQGMRRFGIYKIEGDTLTVALGSAISASKGPRPKAFEGKDIEEVITYRRAK